MNIQARPPVSHQSWDEARRRNSNLNGPFSNMYVIRPIIGTRYTINSPSRNMCAGTTPCAPGCASTSSTA